MIKKDCIFYRYSEKSGEERCSALKQLFCAGERCNFYKTKVKKEETGNEKEKINI